MADELDNREALENSKDLCDRFKILELEKTDLLRRCEDYGMWTLAYIFPPHGKIKNSELQGPMDSTGPQAVNNLSNKLVMTLFQPSQPFFRLIVQDDDLDQIQKDATEGDQDAVEIMSEIDQRLAKAERQAMQELDMNRYRTEATMAAKSLIITGNALMYHPEKNKGRVQMYNLRDYVVVRDLSGTVIEIITRDTKALSTFKKEVRDQILASKDKNLYKNNTQVTIYTQLLLGDDGRYHLKQAADKIELEAEGAWPAEELPWIPLTWNLVRGEDYGRGLVEDYAGAFHALYILAQAEVDVVSIAADIKFLVNPNSTVNVDELNSAESGSYHSGLPEDVTPIQINKAVDMAMVENMVVRLQRQIAAAFLLNSAMIRDAERVTAEEIRTVANELEMAHGGIYSRFAEEWQYRVAVLMLKRTGLDLGTNNEIYPQIITGLDSLSRAGDLDNLRLFIADLAMLDGVPDEMRAAIDPRKFAAFIGIRRGVDYTKFLKSDDQIQQETAAAMQMQQASMNAQAGANIAQEAGKAAMNAEG